MKSIFKLLTNKVFIFTFVVWMIINMTGIHNIYFFGGNLAKVLIIKILHLFFLFFLFNQIYSLYSQRHTSKGKKQIIVTIAYFLILITLLLLTWPGMWSTDDTGMLRAAKEYKLSAWQHFFSGLFYVLCLQTIPFASGVLIIQIIIVSLIVGYCVTTISDLYGKNKKQNIIIDIVLLAIVLLPPLTSYVLTGFRMGMYSYLELLFITKMISLFKEKEKITKRDILQISIVTILISCWRTEGIYYPIMMLILYFVLGEKVIRRKIAIITFLIITIANFSIGKINNLMIGNNNYSIAATMDPMTAIIRNSNESDKEHLEKIDKVIDVDYILNNPDKGSEELFWDEEVMREYSNEEYSEYLKTYAKLLIKYPDVAFKSMWKMFFKSGSGFGEDGKQTTRNMANEVTNTIEIDDIDNIVGTAWYYYNSPLKDPINLEVRRNVTSFLCGLDLDANLTIIHNIFWNLFIPFALILICLIYKLIKKDWFMVFLILTVIARVPLVFATAPAPYFMYYLSVYLCAYVISFIVILEFINGLKNRKSSNKDKNELVVYKGNKIEKLKEIVKQFLSFLLISGVGWVMDFTIYFFLTHFLNLNIILANLLSSTPALTYVFLMSNKQIFKNTTSKLSLKIKYLIYFGYQLILLLSVSLLAQFLYNKLVNVVTIMFLLNNLKIVIKILITPITMTINFIVMKNLIEKL